MKHIIIFSLFIIISSCSRNKPFEEDNFIRLTSFTGNFNRDENKFTLKIKSYIEIDAIGNIKLFKNNNKKPEYYTLRIPEKLYDSLICLLSEKIKYTMPVEDEFGIYDNPYFLLDYNTYTSSDTLLFIDSNQPIKLRKLDIIFNDLLALPATKSQPFDIEKHQKFLDSTYRYLMPPVPKIKAFEIPENF